MGWENYHLFQFFWGYSRFTDTLMGPEDKTASSVIGEFITEEGSILGYEYDFGDGWQYEIVLEEILTRTTKQCPVCTHDRPACPPEDCGGIWGYMEQVKAMKARRGYRYREYEATFPVTDGLDPTYNGGYDDAFVVKVSPPRFFISGRVADASSAPITGIRVLADAGLSTTTNASGDYTLTTILTGTYTPTPTLSGASLWPLTRTVTITSTDVRGQDFTGMITPTDVMITGPLIGPIGTAYTFTAAVRPVTATMPLTYIWTPAPNSGPSMAVATYTWMSEGDKTISVTAENVGGTISSTHVIAIGEQYHIYLPLVLCQFS